MSTNIKRIVIEDISNNTTELHVIFEAVVNSIQAQATKITCRFFSDSALKDENGDFSPRKITGMDICDNGHGFDDEDIASFKDYRTDKKIEYGCKGVGRFCFLKIFRSVRYQSSLKEKKLVRSFPLDFHLDDLKPMDQKDENIRENSTTLFLRDYTTEFITYQKERDRRIELDLRVIKQKVLTHLMPVLHYMKQQNKDILILFVDDMTGESISITLEDVPLFKEKVFVRNDLSGGEITFLLRYNLRKERNGVQAFCCANHRAVSSFSDNGFKLTFPANVSGYFLLESEYLDSHVDNNRNAFIIYPRQETMFSPISWEGIKKSLKPIIAEIVKEEVEEAIILNQAILRQIQQERPYLVDYIQDDDINLAGFLDKHDIIAGAKKRFDAAKESLLAHTEEKNFTDADLNAAIQIAQSELVAYISDRVLTIQRLKTLIEDKEKREHIIHNLLMPQNTTSDYYTVSRNNLWLLDDRFISYSFAASNKRIHTILKNVVESPEETGIDTDRPDISLFFPQDPQRRSGDLKSVIIELKSFDYDKKPARKKYDGLIQLQDYIEAFKKHESLKEIWAFLVTDIDKEFSHFLDRDGYKPLFSTEYPIYLKYYESINSFIYVVSVQTLVADAEARNKVFIDIVQKHNKLQKFLQTDTPSESDDTEKLT